MSGQSKTGSNWYRVYCFGDGTFLVTPYGAWVFPDYREHTSKLKIGEIIKAIELPEEMRNKLAVLNSFGVGECVENIGRRNSEKIYTVYM